MQKQKELCSLLSITHPIIQAGMVYVSGGKLAASAANAGCLGVIGAGSMSLDVLDQHIEKALSLTNSKGLAINTPLLYSKIEDQLNLALDKGIRIFITSAGSPKQYTQLLKDAGAKVLHVVSNPTLAKKCEDAGVDAVIAEGFEAGGHNGRDELTTMVLIPQVVDSVSIPVIAAGGIADGRGIAAAFALGASGVQIGTRFAATEESSAHQNFKQAILDSSFHDTELVLKQLVPVRLLKNPFYQQVKKLEEQGADKESLQTLLGQGRARQGMLNGDLQEGELEIGQISSMVTDIPTTEELVERLLAHYQITMQALTTKDN